MFPKGIDEPESKGMEVVETRGGVGGSEVSIWGNILNIG